MARVLVINPGSEGHVNPTLGVVRELASRGEEVVYFCIEAYRERVEETGAEVRTIDEGKFMQAFLAGGRIALLERVNGLLLTADVVVPSVLAQIEGERFDYLVHDSMFGCGRLLARLLKLPAVCSCTSFAQTEASFERVLAASAARVPAEIAERMHETYHRLTEKTKADYGVEIGSPYEAFCNPAPLTIVYTTRAFQPDGGAFGPSHRFVGPSIAPRAAADDADLAALKAKRPIYISLGTVFNQAADFYRLCFEALGNTEHAVVLSIGSRVRAEELGDIPDNFVVRPYVPQPDVLQSAKLFVTHGGMNSVHEGLYYGVPLVVIPQSADQPIVAGQVARIGAGVRLETQELTAARLREAVGHVLRESSYREAAAAMQASLRESGGYRQAADEILDFMERHRN
ncbi:glycosyl transferase family 1 [Paenibacillus sp. MWE-103]|uniref:Glycosyl transferase family 1 n=1 Tax=Paenibacillus artemisiicola TaxID=1172618 RepID=A0ABS3W3V7_9BACL|nr:macrolide family glycosyltransferase [Paenibacillus artemisiicola]MBO7742977.1 glycosyl transferase family 1 [Paenibacillus artemisiicola]